MKRKPDIAGNLSALLAGFLVFISLAGWILGITLLNERFHSALFQHNQVNAYARFAAENSVQYLKDYAENSSPVFMAQYQGFFDRITESITPEMIDQNLNSLLEGLFRYFRGDTSLLPYLYLSPVPPAASLQLSPDSPVMKAAAALGSVDRISLDAILMYSNRSDIVGFFQLIELLFWLFEWLPGLVFGAALLTGLIAMPVRTGSRRRIWASHTLGSSGILLLLTSLFLCSYVQFFLPARLYPLTSTIPLPESLVLQYAQDCLYSVMILSALSGFGLLAVGQSLRNTAGASRHPGLLACRHAALLPGQSAALPALLLIPAMALVLLAGSFIFVRDFRSQGIEPAAKRLLHPHRKTQVITAADQNLYLLQLAVQEGDTGLPAPNVRMHITGQGTKSETEYQVELQSDEQGKAKLYLDQGTYRLYFPFELFPEAYELPSSFFFNLKTPGITRLDIVLHKKPPAEAILVPETAVYP